MHRQICEFVWVFCCCFGGWAEGIVEYKAWSQGREGSFPTYGESHDQTPCQIENDSLLGCCILQPPPPPPFLYLCNFSR